MHQRVSQKRRRGPLLARLRASPQYAPRLITVDAPPQFLNKSYVDGLAARFFDPAYQAACNANTVFFELMLRNARRLHPDKNLSTLTLLAIFGTDNPSLINAIPREEFIARVNDMKRKLGLPVNARTGPEVAERRAERIARTPTFKHDECSIAFPRKQFDRNLYVHLSGCRPGTAGQPPIPVKASSKFCRSKEACENCQKWVRKVAEGASLETPGAGWVPSRDQVLGVAARVRAALPEITFGGVDLRVAAERKAAAAAPKSRSKTLEEKLMGLTTGQAVGAVKHALRQCNKRSVKGGHMDAATYHSSFVPHFMAHLGLTDVKKVPSQNTLQTIYIAHKGDGRRGRPTAPPPPRSKRARRAPKKMEED